MAKRRETIQTNANVTAVLHKVGRSWCVIAADMQGSKPRILDAREFGSDESTRLNAWIDKVGPGRIICVLPASATICRMVDLPDVPESQLPGVLNLQAEAHLTGIAPSHRMAMAPLPAAPGEGSRTGIVLAWPESAKLDIPPVDREMHYTGDIAGLIGLLGSNRPAEPMAIVDRHSGSIGIAMPYSGGIRYRAASENDGDTAAWLQMALGVFAETAYNAGHDDAFVDGMIESVQQSLRSIDHGEAKLIVPPALANGLGSQIKGAKSDEDWWTKFGIGAGVLLAMQAGLESLADIRREPPQEKPSRILQIAGALSTPRAAIITIAACLILMGTLPTAFTGLRLAALNVRHSDLQNQLRQVKQAEKQLRMYELLSQQAWPMSKLLADLAASTPEGIELETIRMTQGETVTVAGTARPMNGRDAFQLVAKMQENMQRSRIFTNVTYSLGDRSKMVGSYEFDLTALVNNPHRAIDYEPEQDFVTYTMQDRVDGKGPGSDAADDPADANTGDAMASAGNTDAASGGSAAAQDPNQDNAASTAMARGNDDEQPVTITDRDDDDTGTNRPRNPDRTRSGSNNPAGSTRDDAESETANTKVMPELLTEDQINLMEREQVMAALTKVANAKKAFANDEEALEKLDGQFKMLMNRLREAK